MFSWIKQSDLKNLKEPINPATRKDSPQGRIFRQIDAKLKKERNNSSDNDSQEKTFQSNTNILSQADKDENYTSRDEAEIEDNKYKSKKEKEKEGLKKEVEKSKEEPIKKAVEDPTIRRKEVKPVSEDKEKEQEEKKPVKEKEIIEPIKKEVKPEEKEIKPEDKKLMEKII